MKASCESSKAAALSQYPISSIATSDPRVIRIYGLTFGLMESPALHIDYLHQQLPFRAQITQASTRYYPLPNTSTPRDGNETKMRVFLALLHEIYSTLRYAFRAIEMKSPISWDGREIVPSSLPLHRIFSKLATNLLNKSAFSKFELAHLRPVGAPTTLVSVLLLVYNAYLRFPPSYR